MRCVTQYMAEFVVRVLYSTEPIRGSGYVGPGSLATDEAAAKGLANVSTPETVPPIARKGGTVSVLIELARRQSWVTSERWRMLAGKVASCYGHSFALGGGWLGGGRLVWLRLASVSYSGAAPLEPRQCARQPREVFRWQHLQPEDRPDVYDAGHW